MTEELLALCKNRVGNLSCRPGKTLICRGCARDTVAGSLVKGMSESLRGLAFELWRKKGAFQLYRFGEIAIEINLMLQDKQAQTERKKPKRQ